MCFSGMFVKLLSELSFGPLGHAARRKERVRSREGASSEPPRAWSDHVSHGMNLAELRGLLRADEGARSGTACLRNGPQRHTYFIEPRSGRKRSELNAQ